MSDGAEYLGISHLPPESKERLQWLAATEAGMQALQALADLSAALGREKNGNDDETRAIAQRSALAASAKVNAAIGLTALRKRRNYAMAVGAAEGSPATAEDFDKMIAAKDTTAAGKVQLRMARARDVTDAADLWGAHASGALAAQDWLHAMSEDGPLDDDAFSPETVETLREAEGDVGERIKKSGVPGTGGGIKSVLMSTAMWFGGEAGRIAGERGDIPPELWGAARARFNKACAAARITDAKGRPYSMTAKTFSTTFSRRTGGRYPEVVEAFKIARAEATARK